LTIHNRLVIFGLEQKLSYHPKRQWKFKYGMTMNGVIPAELLIL